MSGLSALEQERARRIAENQARLQQIGLLQTVQTIAGTQKEAAVERRARSRANKEAQRAARTAVAGRPRRSERVAGIDAPNYNENARLLSLADGAGDGGSRDRRLMRDNVAEEIYGVEHLDALGSYKQEWELFVDGYNAAGERIYDKVNGQTCHQCRQKTLGKRTACSCCHSLQGVLCGDCLFMRYGENVDEACANPEWVCPLCRDICNCSFHRSKRGWAPTGTLYRRATAEGYKSVAHYLVLNNLADDAKPVALERGLCPPELAAELKKEIAEAAKAGKTPGKKQAAEQEGQKEAEVQREVEEGQAVAGAPQPPAAAVEEQLVQLDAAEPGAEAGKPASKPAAKAATKAAKAATPARRSARGGSSGGGNGTGQGSASTDQGQAAPTKQAEEAAAAPAKAVQAPVAVVPRKRKQGTIAVLAAATKKQQKGSSDGTAALAAAKGVADAPPRRGLRSSARVRAAAP